MTGLIRELFMFNVYKRSQGRLVRRLTMIGIFAFFAWGAYSFTQWMEATAPVYATAGVFVLAGLWFAYRLINYSRFADFLIAVEAEMVKVSWPSNKELYITTVVVIVTMILLTFSLYSFDFILYHLFGLLRKIFIPV